MFPNKCKAVLMTENDDILEYGEAKVSLKNKTIDFTSSFVPLMTIGTTVKLICNENNINTHFITGSTYLSSPNLLRIENINIKLLENAEKVLSIETSIPAQILETEQKSGFFNVKTVKKWIDCTVSLISADRLHFYTTWRKTSSSNISMIRISQPVFPSETDIKLKIGGKPLIFGEQYKYIYNITEIDENDRTSLLTFIKQYSTLIIDNINFH